jgi:hypothetical protein
MFIFAADKPYIGGYGDRIVGLISCKVMADLLGRNFRILWTRENIRPYFTYDKYDYENELAYDTILYNVIDNQTLLKQTLMTSANPFEKTFHMFNINVDISQYLYKNPRFSNRDYYHDILSTYRTLYTDIFVPTPACMRHVESVVPSDTSGAVIGIQIRTGDIYIPNIYNNTYRVMDNPDVTLPSMLQTIKRHIEQTYRAYKVFLTSDYELIYTIAKGIWDPTALLYDAHPVQHLDRAPKGDMTKLFADSYILSQKTHALYISECSNFGRVAALSSTHTKCFNLQCEALDLRTLLSKHEHYEHSL